MDNSNNNDVTDAEIEAALDSAKERKGTSSSAQRKGKERKGMKVNCNELFGQEEN